MATEIVTVRDAPRQQVEELLVTNTNTLTLETVAWKYYDEAFNRDRDRGFVLMQDDNVIGFLGVIPFDLVADNQRWPSGWLCDWYCTAPGMGAFLLHAAIKSSGHVVTFGGNENSRPIFSRFGNVTYPEAGDQFYFQSRLSFGRSRLAKRMPKLRLDDWPVLGKLPMPRAPHTTPGTEIAIEPGVSDVIGDILDDLPTGSCRPAYDLAFVHWSLGRCPHIESWTASTPQASHPRAAVVFWRSVGSARNWRLLPLAHPGASDELSAVMAGAIRRVKELGGEGIAAVASRHDTDVQTALRQSRFHKRRKVIPLSVHVAAGAPQPTTELHQINYLASDMAYRF